MAKIGGFTQRVVGELRQRLANLQPKADKASEDSGGSAQKDALMNEAKRIGEDYLQLEKYANLNYMVSIHVI